MSGMDRMIDAITGAIRLTDRVEALSREVSALAVEVKGSAGEMRELDRRLVRIEALVEFTAVARSRASAPDNTPRAIPAAAKKSPPR